MSVSTKNADFTWAACQVKVLCGHSEVFKYEPDPIHRCPPGLWLSHWHLRNQNSSIVCLSCLSSSTVISSRPRLLPTWASVPGSPSRSSTNDYFQLRFSLEILNRQVLRCQGVVGKVQLLKCSLTQEMYRFEGNCMTSSSERSKVINEFMVEYCNNMSRFRLARIATFTLYTRFNIGSTSIQ